jgi:hypothetical protein
MPVKRQISSLNFSNILLLMLPSKHKTLYADFYLNKTTINKKNKKKATTAIRSVQGRQIDLFT